VRFALLDNATRTARVDPELWRGPESQDVAFLRLDDAPPADAKVLPIGASAGTRGHTVKTYGFAVNAPSAGTYGFGVVGDQIVGDSNEPLLQLTRCSGVTEGFSGAPVLDEHTGLVLGILNSISSPNRVGHSSETAYITPTETLREICSEVRGSDICPYQGLQPFTVADAVWFHGRDRAVNMVLARLGLDRRFVTLLGPSASGKSSLIHAGVLPALVHGQVPGSDRWGWVSVRPGAEPFAELEQQGLPGAAAGLAAASQRWFAEQPDRERLVLVLDQCEELFTTTPAELREELFEQLTALTKEQPALTVIMVVQDYFYSQMVAAAPDLMQLLQQGLVNIPAVVEPDELRAIIERPANLVGLTFEPGLIERIAEDAVLAVPPPANVPSHGAAVTVLPVLEFALTTLWYRRKDGRLTHHAYQQTGGMRAALARWHQRLPDAAANPATPNMSMSVRWAPTGALSSTGAQAVLIGTGTHLPRSGLPDVPAVSTTLADLKQALVRQCGMVDSNVRVLADPLLPLDVGRAVTDSAKQAKDVLLIYYIGHGMVSPSGQFYLATKSTERDPELLPYTALSYSAVRTSLLQSPARSTVVILDCCFSGMALEGVLGAFGPVDLAQVHGGYVLTSSGRDELALAPAGATHTAFTGELIDLLTRGDPEGPPLLTLRYVYQYLTRVLTARGFPSPQRRASEWIEDLVLAPNPAYRPPWDAPPHQDSAPQLQSQPTRKQHEEAAATSERKARIAVAHKYYSEARSEIAFIAEVDPSRARQLLDEFGMLIYLDEDRHNEHIDWLTGVWVALAASIEYEWPRSGVTVDKVRLPSSDAKPVTESPIVNPSQPSGSAHVLGSSLEDSFLKLLRELFLMSQVTETKIISRLRAQTAGTQFGHDIEFDALDTYGRGVKCHVECKNYRSAIKLADIADKLLQTEFYWRDKQLDHWILISPHADASNELSLMVQSWNTTHRYPFNIQLWTPESGIRELFRFTPEVYEKIYGTRDLGPLSSASKDILLEQWRSKIAPIARVPSTWLRYLKGSLDHCFPDEDAAHFEEIYSNPIPLQALTESGLPLNSALETVLRDWLRGTESRSLLLLAEFGEGKSFFTYYLSRRLAEEFLKQPDDGWIPLRLSLRAFRAQPYVGALLASRLSEIGSDVSEWRQIAHTYRTLVTLDGFDEMSVNLDPSTISRNIRALAEFREQLGDSKLLITSRTHFFENRRDQQRFLDHADCSQIYRIAPIPRTRGVAHLSAHAKKIGAEEKLRRLKRLHDPIGLAAKPLFLQMIKETLPKLPDDHFNELALYRQYTQQSLERKLHDLRDELSTVIDQELIDNLHVVLEHVAVSLYTSQSPYIDLKNLTIQEGVDLAEVLWKISDAPSSNPPQPSDADPETANKDARARLGIRSLLKPVRNVAGDSWPVDFFHRSMREYFVARALVRAITSSQQQAIQILSHVPLRPEIINFAVLLMKEQQEIIGDRSSGSLFEDMLYSLARSAVLPMYAKKHLGGNAISLLHALTHRLPHTDWSGLALDYAYLADANLKDMSFQNSSMRYANLDNTQLDGADFREADLTGVQLEETAAVLDLVLDEDKNCVYAVYGDKTVRRWSLGAGGRITSNTVHQISFTPNSLGISPFGDLVIGGQEDLVILSQAGTERSWRVISRFKLRPDIREFAIQRDCVAVRQDAQESEYALNLYAPGDREIKASLALDRTGPFHFTSPCDVFVSTEGGHVAIRFTTSDGSEAIKVLETAPMSCIDVKVLEKRELLVILGHGDGNVSLWRMHIDEASVSVEEIWNVTAHTEAVTTVQISESFVVSGAMDRTVCLFTFTDQWCVGEPLRLHRTLSCEGMRIEGVKGERERQLLQALIEAT
jgi:hypothetical protein